MKIDFSQIHIKNFLSFEEAVLSFDKNGFISVIGNNLCAEDNSVSNGSGKSSIWEAISWCLTGETIRGTKTVKRIGSDSPCEVELLLTVDEDEFIINRQSDPSKLFIFRNGENISGKGIRDSEKILASVLPDITPMLIGSVIILGQGLPQKFSSNTPAGRKEILEKLSKSDFMIDDIKERVSKRKQQLLNSLSDANAKKIETETKKKFAESTIENNSVDFSAQVSEIESFISDKTAEISKLRSNLDVEKEKLDKLKSSYTSVDYEIVKLDNDLKSELFDAEKDVKEDISVTEKSIYELKLRIKALNDEIQSIRNIKDVCPTCGQKLQKIVKPSTESQEIEVQKLQSELTGLSQILSDKKLTISDIELTVTEKYKEKRAELNTQKTSIDAEIRSLKIFVDDLERNVKSLDKSISEKTIQLEVLRSKQENAKRLIEENKKVVADCDNTLLYIYNIVDDCEKRQAILNKFETCIKRDFRGYLLGNIINYIDAQSKLYCKDVFGTTAISFSLDGNNISIAYNGKEYECLSGGERQKIDVIVQFALRDMLCKYLDFSSNILVLDEITDNLDNVGVSKIVNLITTRLNDLTSIYIISHHKDLQLPDDYQLVITKGVDGISRIQ